MNKDFLVVFVGPLITLILADSTIRTALDLEVTPLDVLLRALFMAAVLWWIWVMKSNKEEMEKFENDPANPTSSITPMEVAHHLSCGGTVDWSVLCRLSELNPILLIAIEVDQEIDYGSIVVANAFWGTHQRTGGRRSRTVVVDKSTATMYVSNLPGDSTVAGRGILHVARTLRDRGVAIDWIVGTHRGDNRLKDGYTDVIKSDL